MPGSAIWVFAAFPKETRQGASLRELHVLLLHAGQCKLDLQLVSQEVESVWLSALYPVNAMRNRALAGVETEVRPPTCLPAGLPLVAHAAAPPHAAFGWAAVLD